MARKTAPWDIHGKTLVLEDESGARTVLATSNLLGFIKEVSNPIGARVLKQFGIPREIRNNRNRFEKTNSKSYISERD